MNLKIKLDRDNMKLVVDAAESESRNEYGTQFNARVGSLILAGLRTQGVESVSKDDPEFLESLAAGLGEALADLGFSKTLDVFLGNGGYERYYELKDDPARLAALETAVDLSGALSFVIDGLPTEYFRYFLIVILDGVSDWMAYETSDRTLGSRI